MSQLLAFSRSHPALIAIAGFIAIFALVLGIISFSSGIVFFQMEHERVFGLQVDSSGRLVPQLSYAYTFNLQKMKAPPTSPGRRRAPETNPFRRRIVPLIAPSE